MVRRYCPTRTAARGDHLRPKVPPCGAHWPLHLCSSHLFSGSDSFTARISRNFQRVRLSDRQPKPCNSRERELPRSKFANDTARVAVSRGRGASSRLLVCGNLLNLYAFQRDVMCGFHCLFTERGLRILRSRGYVQLGFSFAIAKMGRPLRLNTSSAVIVSHQQNNKGLI